MDPKAPDKKERLLSALERGMVMVHLDARRTGVRVPLQLKREAHLRLNLSYRFEPPDLQVSDWGVHCTLSFSGTRFKVAIPWSALFAITSHVTKEFWMYPDDMPPELLQAQPPPQPPKPVEVVALPPPCEEPQPEPRADAETAADPEPEEPERPAEKPPRHLYLVK